MSMWEDKATFSRFLDQAVNNGNVGVIQEIFHEQFVGFLPDKERPVEGPDDVRRWVETLRIGFPDLNSLIEGGWLVSELGTHEVGKGTTKERVAAFVVLRGTHSGSFAGVPATNRWVTWGEVHLLTFQEGRIVQDVVVRDTYSLLRQIGVTTLTAASPPIIIPPELI